MTIKSLKGIHRCSHCGNLEVQEREVICWACGKGEMLWYSADDLSNIFNSKNVVLFPAPVATPCPTNPSA